MEYEEFKYCLVERLRDFYGKDAKVSVTWVRKYNEEGYEGLQIVMTGTEQSIVPIISLKRFYEEYSSGDIDMDGCIGEICRIRDKDGDQKELQQIAKSIQEWDFAKDHVYPMLISTSENEKLLKELVSTPMLDLSVVYILRGSESEDTKWNVKVTKELKDHYGISCQELQEAAMKNLENDNYAFRELEYILNELFMGSETVPKGEVEEWEPGKMYILTNSISKYGAAGILNRKLLGTFAKGHDFYILPSSIHETIFIPVMDGDDSMKLDRIIKEVNCLMVEAEERLSDHSYFYDGKTGEIRMCEDTGAGE